MLVEQKFSEQKRSRQLSKDFGRLLARLARPGAVAFSRSQSAASQGSVSIRLPCGTESELSGLMPDLLLRAGRLGLVEPGGERGSSGVILAKAGRAWLKRHLSGGDPFQDQHRELSSRDERLPGGGANRLTVNDSESPLAWLRTRKDKAGNSLLTDAQFAAGERLRADFWFAGMEPRVTANWAAYATIQGPRQGAVSHGGNIRDEQLAARQRVRRAFSGVGAELSTVLLDVCCELRGLEEVERFRGWPQRSGKLVLQLALSALARHYGLISNQFSSDAENKTGRSGKLAHWGTEDYRPRIDGDG